MVPSKSRSGAQDVMRWDAIFDGNREAWLQRVIDVWRPLFDRAGRELPTSIRVSVGRPPSGSHTGVYYPPDASDDGVASIFVHPVISDSTRAAGIVVHLLCHAALGDRKHGIMFRHLATRVGLIGPMRKTMEGPLFQQIMPFVIDRAGLYPHAALRQIKGLDKLPPGSRLIRARCLGCGYTLRAAQKWLSVGVPTCPNPRCEERGAPMEIG
jgi:hypothetical protein